MILIGAAPGAINADGCSDSVGGPRSKQKRRSLHRHRRPVLPCSAEESLRSSPLKHPEKTRPAGIHRATRWRAGLISPRIKKRAERRLSGRETRPAPALVSLKQTETSQSFQEGKARPPRQRIGLCCDVKRKELL